MSAVYNHSSTQIREPEEAYNAIKKIAKHAKYDYKHPNPNEPNKIKPVAEGIYKLRVAQPKAASLLADAYVAWIKKRVLPLNTPKTMVIYQMWMEQLAATHAPLASLMKVDVQTLQAIKEKFVKVFGESAFASPFVDYVLENGKSFEYKLLFHFITKEIPYQQINHALADTIIFKNSSLMLRDNVVEIIEAAVAVEMENQPNWQELFRDESLARKLFHRYAKRVSSDWLKPIFSNISPGSNEQQYADQIVKNIKESKLPPGISRILDLIRDKTRAKFPPDKVWNLPMSQLFLNVICHSFRFPREWGLPALFPPFLREITNALQKAANNWEVPPGGEKAFDVSDSKGRLPAAEKTRVQKSTSQDEVVQAPSANLRKHLSLSAYPLND